jgi:periplasmic protein TonB
MLRPVSPPPSKMVWAPRSHRRAPLAAIGVILAHVAGLALLLYLRDEPREQPVPLQSVQVSVISASPRPAPQPAAKPVTPPAPKPSIKPPVRVQAPVPPPAESPRPAPQQAQQQPAAPAAPPVAPAAPASETAPAHPTLALNVPKNVSHVDCSVAKPDYPYQSQRRGETGTARVRFVIGLDGRIEEVSLAQSSGSARLDGAALNAMRQSSCQPYKENGEAIRAAYTQPFVFDLND